MFIKVTVYACILNESYINKSSLTKNNFFPINCFLFYQYFILSKPTGSTGHTHIYLRHNIWTNRYVGTSYIFWRYKHTHWAIQKNQLLYVTFSVFIINSNLKTSTYLKINCECSILLSEWKTKLIILFMKARLAFPVDIFTISLKLWRSLFSHRNIQDGWY